MSDMTLAERYMTARTTSSMLVKERTTHAPADIITAAGMAGSKHGLALQLWAFAHQPSGAALRNLRDTLATKLADHMLAKKLNGKPRDIAKQVLAWWAHGTCTHCDGLGFERIQGTPHLSDTQCGHCHGSGKAPLETSNNEAANWLLKEIGMLASSAEIAIRNKIK